MASMQWDNSLSVGVELIDEQHKKWIEHLNDVLAAVESHQGATQISRTLSFLVDYTQVHFATEEKYMTDNNYSGLDNHKAKHEQLKETLNTLVQDFEEEGATSPLSDAVETFLQNWLTRHIREVDMLFGSFLQEKGIILPAEA